MKREKCIMLFLWILLVLVVFCMFNVSNVFAATDGSLRHDIHIEWAFDDTLVGNSNVHGFRLFKDDVCICYFIGKDTREGECMFNSPPGTYLFTMTAVQPDGYQSPHSDDYDFTIDGVPMEMTILQIKFVIEE